MFLLHDFQCNDDNWYPYYPRVCNADGTPKLKRDETGKLVPYGLPETEKMGDAIFEKMDKARQLFWFGLLRKFANGTITEDELKSRWADLTHGARAFTNKHGWNNGLADYINGVNLNASPMCQENVTTCGNKVIKHGEKPNYHGILCLDGTKLPTVDEIMAHDAMEYFIHRATICRPEAGTQPNFPRLAPAPHGTFVVNPFPQLGGLDVPVPLISSRGEQVVYMGLNCRVNWIAQRRLVTLDNDENPSAYVR